MSVTLHLPQNVENQLADEASRLGLGLPDYIVHLLVNDREARQVRTGPDLVEYWRRAGLIGSRQDIQDSAAEARAIRSAAEIRRKP